MFVARLTIGPPVPYERVVTRWITHGGILLNHLLERIPHQAGYLLVGGGRLRVAERFTRCDSGMVPTWTAAGRIYGAGLRLVRFARVNIKVTAWSATVCELQLCPASRNLRRWGVRRQARYFDFAHRSADTLVHLLLTPPSTPEPAQNPASSYFDLKK